MNYKKSLVTSVGMVSLLVIPTSLASAQNFISIVELPGISSAGDIGQFINSLYAIAIGLAALLAVVKIVIAGIKYMLTDLVTNKEEGRKEIKGALLGLLIVIAAVLVLELINPNLVNLNIALEPVRTDRAGSGSLLIPGSDTTQRKESWRQPCDYTGGQCQDPIEGGSPVCTGGSYDCSRLKEMCLTVDGGNPLVSRDRELFCRI